MNYSFLKGLQKGVIAVIIFAVPVLVGQFPEVANLTIGGILLMVANYLKVSRSSK